MGCGSNNDSLSCRHCVCEVVRAINDIQNAVEENCECPSNCFKEPLGSLVSPASQADTRVFVLSTADGSPFHAFFASSGDPCVSIYFRVEDVFDNCCATLRVLRPLGSNNQTVDLTSNSAGDRCCIDLNAACSVVNFASTNSCITVDLTCFCAIQCIRDVDLNICE